MRIRILSDLHQEFSVTPIPSVDVDLIVLAGDINTKTNAVKWVQTFCGTTPTAYVCGNHEFYGDSLPRVTELLKEKLKGTTVHVLENDSFDVAGWHVFGCTLWTDMALFGNFHEGVAIARETMNEYKCVRNSSKGYKRLSPMDTHALHRQSLEKMRSFFASHDPRRTIVVTHHAPTLLSLPEERRTEDISCAYASHLDEFIREFQPPLWIHGHIHSSSDYLVGSTRVLANPQGYPMEPNPDFVSDMVVEVGEDGFFQSVSTGPSCSNPARC